MGWGGGVGGKVEWKEGEEKEEFTPFLFETRMDMDGMGWDGMR